MDSKDETTKVNIKANDHFTSHDSLLKFNQALITVGLILTIACFSMDFYNGYRNMKK